MKELNDTIKYIVMQQPKLGIDVILKMSIKESVIYSRDNISAIHAKGGVVIPKYR